MKVDSREPSRTRWRMESTRLRVSFAISLHFAWDGDISFEFWLVESLEQYLKQCGGWRLISYYKGVGHICMGASASQLGTGIIDIGHYRIVRRPPSRMHNTAGLDKSLLGFFLLKTRYN